MESAPNRLRWIGHADLDAFYASVEQRDAPQYRNRPVVVGAQPGQRGVVAAASYAARAFGIHSAMPIAEAYRRCPDAVYLRPDMERYMAASREVFRILESISPLVEPVSVDEAYLDLSGLEKLFGAPLEIGRIIKQRIFEQTALTVSVGIGPNRLIAKLGSEHRKPDGLTVIYPEEVASFLAPMPIANLRGLGRQTEKIFARLGIATVGQLRSVPLAHLERHLGRRAAERFRQQAMGVASSEVSPCRNRKSLSKETTFEVDTDDSDFLHGVLGRLAGEVARKIRAEGLAGSVVTLKIRFRGFETHTRQRRLGQPTSDERVILKAAWRLFQHSGLPRNPVRLIGVGISHWQQSEPVQGDLFEPRETAELDARLLRTIDQANDRFGKGVLHLGMARTRAESESE